MRLTSAAAGAAGGAAAAGAGALLGLSDPRRRLGAAPLPAGLASAALEVLMSMLHKRRLQPQCSCRPRSG